MREMAWDIVAEGSTSRPQRSMAKAQRWWNSQLRRGSIGFGGSPPTGVRARVCSSRDPAPRRTARTDQGRRERRQPPFIR